MFRRFAPLLFLLLAASLAGAAPLEAVQRELRSRRYYFGPVDGRASPETTAALREFQRSKALDASGVADEETRRALGLAPAGPASPEARAQQLGRSWIARYWSACEQGEWAKEEPFYADKLRYYGEIVTRGELREQRRAYGEAFPRRRHQPQLSFATWADGERELWITARVRHEITSAAGRATTEVEELLFKLRERAGAWQAFEISLAPERGAK